MGQGCPLNSEATAQGCICKRDYAEDPAANRCVQSSPEPQLCQAGTHTTQPIVPAAQAKIRTETDWAGQGPAALSFTRYYRSTWALHYAESTRTMSKVWTHNHSTYLKRVATPAGTSVGIITGEGYRRSFFKATDTNNWVATNSNDTLVQDASGAWTYRRMDDDATLVFDAPGKLLTVTARNGWVTTYAYDGNGLLASVSNAFGQTITFFHYGGKLVSVTVPGQGVIWYMYNGEYLYRITYPDNTTRFFQYEHVRSDQLLTGITDEAGVRWATFDYDSAGRAIRSELAGGVERYQVSYPGPNGGATTVTDPLGTTRAFNYTLNLGKLVVTGADKPDGIGQPDAASRVQSDLGLITEETDFQGTSTTYLWNTDRRLPIATTEAAGKPEERTTGIEWHLQWRLPVAVYEPGRVTGYTYDSLGNRLTQTITDTGAGMGSGIARTTTWTYHPSGLVATETAPNGAATSYQYDSAGNLTSTTNALGHADTYTHDAAGRVLTHTSPTGATTTYTYDARGRLLTASVDGQVTTLTYRPTGQAATATMPHGHVVTYTYDAAQRLTGWSDNRGNAGTYTLDAIGNRTQEEIRNAQGQLAWTLARNINSLNRLDSITLGGQQTTTQGYDANGDTVRSTNGLGEATQYGLDALRRVQAITDAQSATASLTYNALDSVTQAKDFKGVNTTYSRDTLGNATGESSPDSGL
ncbi:DUF6531 domain-containing protein, partial [Acidovorax sp. LjRoot117]|uniref:RHS repeat domain-containing protein n=1 Tax=Acidovorax sp. LjRoot117 TaxID=3342255 RepID=UPI003F50B5C9